MNHSLMFRTFLVCSFFVPTFGLSQMDSTLPQRENSNLSSEARQETIYRVLNNLAIELSYVEQRVFHLRVAGERNLAKSDCDGLWNKLDTLKTSITTDSTLTKDDIQYLVTRLKDAQEEIIEIRDTESLLVGHEIELPMPVKGKHNPE